LNIALGLLMAFRMGLTINRICGIVSAAAKGDLSMNPSSRSRDELGVLTKSISSMISDMRLLIGQVQDITQKVDSSAFKVAGTFRQVSSASHEISKAIRHIAQGASSQAADSENASAKIDELVLKINDVSLNTGAIKNFCDESAGLTRLGLSLVEDLTEKSGETTKTTKTILSDVQALDLHSKSIGNIAGLIRRIADQTSLLALNASIEAARAGSAGRGFSVVAEEIRKLAGEATEATHEIALIIKDIRNQTSQAAKRAISVEETLKSQNNTVSNAVAVNTIHHITEISQETAALVQEVTASVEEQATTIDDLAVYSQELADTSANLSHSISKFKI